MDIPKIFWKYYDVYRRRMITFAEFVTLTGIKGKVLNEYLMFITKTYK